MKFDGIRSGPRRGSAVLSLSLSLVSAVLIPASVVAIAALGGTSGPASVADAVVPDTTMLAPDRTERAGTSALYGIENGFNVPEDNRLDVIDPSNGDILSSVQVTIPGFDVRTSNGLAIDPTDGEMYAVVRATEIPPLRGSGPESVPGASGGPVRMLITLDRDTGVGAVVGEIDGIGGVAGIAFKPDGTLIAVTGDGGSPPETLFEIDKTDASTTFVLTLGNGDDGEAIACHENGLLYHASGISEGDMFFESVDLDTLVVTDRSNPEHAYDAEVLALGYSGQIGEMFRTDRDAVLSTIDVVTGEATTIGTFPDDIQMKGLAFDEVPPPPPPPGEGGVLEDGIRTIFLERGPALGISPMNVVYHPGFELYYASNGGDPAWSAWVYEADGTRIQTLESIGVDVRAWTYNPNLVNDSDSSGLEILSFDAQDGDGGFERGLVHPGVEFDTGLLTGETTIVLPELPGLIDRQTAPSYDPARNMLYSRALGTLVHVVDRDTGELVETFDLDFDAAGVIDSDVLGWSLGYDPELKCLIAADQTYDRALVFELDGTFVGASNIDMDINRQWGVAYTNGQFFIWSDERNGWQGYLIKVETDPCDDCPCPEDVDKSGEVDFQDIVALLAEWGPCEKRLGARSSQGGPVALEGGDLVFERTLNLNGDDGYYSDIVQQQIADSFMLDADAAVVGATWYGNFERLGDPFDTGDTVEFLVRFFEDEDGRPRTEPFYEAPVTAVVTDDGIQQGQDRIYLLTSKLPPVTVRGGTKYYISVLSYEAAVFRWNNGTPDDGVVTARSRDGRPWILSKDPPRFSSAFAIFGGDPCDFCPCPADVNRDGVVDFLDIVNVLAAWGPCEPGEECDDCEDGMVDECGFPEGLGCIDCVTPEGDCVCVENAICDGLQVCGPLDGQCPPGFFCCVNTCCPDPVCLPLCESTADAPDSQPEAVRAGRSAGSR